MRTDLLVNLDKGALTDYDVALERMAAGHWPLRLLFEKRDDDGQTWPYHLRELRVLELSLGRLDAPPVTGGWRISVGGSDLAWMDAAVTAERLRVALAGAAGAGVTVRLMEAGCWWWRAADGARHVMAVRGNELRPASFVRLREFEQSGAWWHEIRLAHTPLAWTGDWDRLLRPKPVVTVVQEGYTQGETGFRFPEIQALRIPPGFDGAFRLGFEGYTTGLLGRESKPEDYRRLLGEMMRDGRGGWGVDDPRAGTAYITFGGDLAGVDWPMLTVHVEEHAPGDVVLDLDLTMPELAAEMADKRETELLLECRALVTRPEEWDDPEAGVRPVWLFRQAMKFQRPMIFPGLGEVPGIDWLRPREPRTYVPYDRNMVVTGNQFYEQTIGDGETREWVIAHGLGTRRLVPVVRENGGDGRILDAGIYTVDAVSDDEVLVRFPVETWPVAPAEAEVTVLLVSAATVSAWQAHGHEIDHISGLRMMLESLNTAIEELNGMFYVPGAGGMADRSWTGTIALPPVAEVFPAMVSWGKCGGGEALCLPALPRAIKNVSPAEVTADALPEAKDATGAVYRFSGPRKEVYVPGGRNKLGGMMKSSMAPAVLSDGNYWFAAKEGPTGIYYPVEMERILFEIPVTPEQLAPGRTLRVATSFLLGLAAERPELRASYLFRVRKGRPVGEAAFGSAVNIEGVEWDAHEGVEELLFEQRLTVSRSGHVHTFSLEVARDAVTGDLSASRTIYGRSLGAPAPQHGHFILRGELTRFDLENYNDPTAVPVGQVYLLCGEAEDATGDAAEQILKRFRGAKEALRLSATIN